MNKKYQKILDLSPVQENIVDLCRAKTFVWAQLLDSNKEKEIYFCYNEMIDKVSFYSYEEDIIKLNYNIIITKLDDKYFIFKILLDTQNKTKDKDIYNYKPGEELKDKKCFLFPETIVFVVLEKVINEELYRYSIYNKASINIRHLFKLEIELVKIVLIDNKKFIEILNYSKSDYTKQIINMNTISYSDITFLIFHHPNLLDLKKIKGFIYYNKNQANLVDTDMRFKVNN